VLICIGAILDWGTCTPIREFPELSPTNYLYALGTMLFTYGGHSAFPTIQHDMKKPSEFNRSSYLGFFGKHQNCANSLLFLLFSDVHFQLRCRWFWGICLWEQFARLHHQLNPNWFVPKMFISIRDSIIVIFQKK
jgi:hypothetical protein